MCGPRGGLGRHIRHQAERNGVDVGFVTQGPYTVKVGFRFYLMLHDKEYQLVHMLGKEISFNVEMSNMPWEPIQPFDSPSDATTFYSGSEWDTSVQG